MPVRQALCAAWKWVCLLFCIVALPVLIHAEQRHARELNAGWEFRQVVAQGVASEWHPAQVPGDVHLDLLANKLIPDPFYRDNEGKLQWIEQADWEYRSSLTIDPAELKHEHVEL